MAAFADGCGKVLTHAFRDQEFSVFWPAIRTLGQADLIFVQWLAMRLACLLLVGRAISNVAVNDDQRRALLRVVEMLEGAGEQIKIVGIADASNVPAITHKARGDIFSKRQLGVALNGDVVVVVNPAEIGELEMACERGSLARDALHHVAVTTDGINVVIEQLKARLVEVRGLPLPGDRHANAVGHALAQRAGGGLNAGSQAIFGVAGTFAIELAEVLDVIERDRGFAHNLVIRVYGFYAGEVQERIEQHGGVSVGEDKAIAV